MNKDRAIHPVPLALEIMRIRKEKHPLGSNFGVRVRLGHAEIQDATAIAELLSAVYELGYEIVRKPAAPGPAAASGTG